MSVEYIESSEVSYPTDANLVLSVTPNRTRWSKDVSRFSKEGSRFTETHPSTNIAQSLSPPSTTSSGLSSSRPTSAASLSRAVQIVEFSDANVNPTPRCCEGTETMIGEYLSPHRLTQLTGHDNLNEVHTLDIKVNTKETSLGNFGAYVPNLTQLRLGNSVVTSIRDLGSCLTKLEILWMPRCGLSILDGVAAMSSLCELYLAYNEISDISPCSFLSNVQLIDLEGNLIEEMSQVTFLDLCPSLTCLTLEGNPICLAPSPNTKDPSYNYRDSVRKAVPRLRMLDDQPLTPANSTTSISVKVKNRRGASDRPTNQSQATMARGEGDTLSHSDDKASAGGETVSPTSDKKGALVFEEDWKLLEELIEEGTPIEEKVEVPTSTRPGSRPQTAAYRPGSALRPYTAGLRPSGTSRSGDRSSSSVLGYSNDGEGVCDLTKGGVVSGNLSRALKNRKKTTVDKTTERKLSSQLPSDHSSSVGTCTGNTKTAGTNTAGVGTSSQSDSEVFDEKKYKKLREELSQWKIGHQKRVTAIKESKQPQILKIDVDDIGDLTSDEESCSGDSPVNSSRLERTGNKTKAGYKPSRDMGRGATSSNHGDGVNKLSSPIQNRRFMPTPTQVTSLSPLKVTNKKTLLRLEADKSREGRLSQQSTSLSLSRSSSFEENPFVPTTQARLVSPRSPSNAFTSKQTPLSRRNTVQNFPLLPSKYSK